MSSFSDQIPDALSFNHLLEPQPYSVAVFGAVCDRIDALGSVDRPDADPETGEIPDFRSLSFARESFANGSSITAHSVHGDAEYMEAWGTTEPTRSIYLTTADSSKYEYSAYSTGREKLFIKKLGERVLRDIDPTKPLEASSDTGLGVGLRGTPDVMRRMLEGFAERQEADKHGLSKPTDGSLREFTEALQAALDSGVVPKSE